MYQFELNRSFSTPHLLRVLFSTLKNTSGFVELSLSALIIVFVILTSAAAGLSYMNDPCAAATYLDQYIQSDATAAFRTSSCHTTDSTLLEVSADPTLGAVSRGERGPKGDDGATGAKGEKGDKGDTGLTGAAGSTGLTGSTGATGADGAAASIWGPITGTLSDQLDLQSALDDKQDALASLNISQWTNDSAFIGRTGLSSTATGLSYDNGTGVFSLTAGSVIPSTTEQTNWNTAFGWGNHAGAGYLTGTKVDSFNTRTGAVTLSALDVTGALTFTPYDSTNPAGYITDGNSGWNNSYGLITADDTLTGLVRSTAIGDSYITGGNVGIGTTDPTTPLVVYGTGGGVAGRTWATVQNTAVDSAAGIQLKNSAGRYAAFQYSGPSYTTGESFSLFTQNDFPINFTTNGSTSSGGSSHISFSPGGYSNETVRFLANGNVGIGTTTPSTLLQISSGNDGTGGVISAKDGGAILMASNGDHALQVGNNTGGANSIRFRVDVNGKIEAGSTSYFSTAADPGISFFGDNNTGIFTPTANTFAIAYGGVEGMRINSAGNVGIGTTAPSAKLDVAGDRSLSGQLFVHSNVPQSDGSLLLGSTIGIGANIYAHTNPDGTVAATASAPGLRFSSSGLDILTSDETTGARVWDQKVRVGIDGSVGIGTTAPANKLEVQSTTGPQLRVAYDGSNYFTQSVSSAGAITLDATGASAGFSFSDDVTLASGQLYITGIASSASTTEGTVYYDTDDDNLYVYANGGWVDLTVQGGSNTFSNGLTESLGAVKLGGALTENTNLLADNAEVFSITNTGTGNSLLIEDEASDASPFVIDATGNVGIGTTAPTSFLTVAGSTSAKASLNLTSSATAPSAPVDGDIYYDTAKDSLMIYTGSKWQADRSTTTLVVAASDSMNKEKADYVADGTGDQTEIEAAITALPAGGGAIVLLDGTYSISADITIDKSNVRLIGLGRSTLLSRAFNDVTARNTGVITISDNTTTRTNIEVAHLRIEGNKATYTSDDNHGIFVRRATDIKIDNVYIENSGGDGVNFYNSGAVAVTGSVISNSTISGSGANGIWVDSVNLTNGRIINNNIATNTLYGVFLDSGIGYVNITGNIFKSNTQRGISVLGGGYNVISSNIFQSSGEVALRLRATNNNTVTGNTITSSVGAGIYLYTATENVISGNNISAGSAEGIYLDASSNRNSITGNLLESNATSGIRVYFGSDDNQITNNRLYSNTASSSSSSIYIDYASDSTVVKNNYIRDTAGTGYAIRIGNSISASIGTILGGNNYGGTGAATISDSGTSTMYEGQLAGASANDLIFTPGGNVGIGTTAPTGKLHVADTSNTASSLFVVNNTATTIGAGANTLGVIDLHSTSLTTGNFINTELSALTAGKILNLSSTSTALSTGNLASLDWSPSGSTEIYATGDLLKINAGQYGNVGNFFAIYDNGSEVFSIDQAKITNALPTEFTAAGDVSFAYDAVFTNPTASYIKFEGPGYIQTSHPSGNYDLTLSAANTGVVSIADQATITGVNTAAGSANALTLSGTLGAFDNSDTFRGVYLNYTNANHAGTVNAFNGLDIAGITADAEATETAIKIGTGWDYGIYSETAGVNYFAGKVGIGMTDPSVALDVTGDVEYTGTLTDVSDERLKENIRPITSALSVLSNIDGKSFNMIGDDRTEYGFTAQNVKQYIPDAVSFISPGTDLMGVNYFAFTPFMVEAIKEQQVQIEALQKVANYIQLPTSDAGALTFLSPLHAPEIFTPLLRADALEITGITFATGTDVRVATEAIASLTDRVVTIENSLRDAQTQIAGLDAQVRSLVAASPSASLATSNATMVQALVETGGLTVTGDATFEGVAYFKGAAAFFDSILMLGRVTYEDQDIAGYARVTAGMDRVEVVFDKPYRFTPIVNISARSKAPTDRYWITNETESGFTIEIDQMATEDLEFAWVTTAVKNPRTVLSSDATASASLSPTATPSGTLAP